MLPSHRNAWQEGRRVHQDKCTKVPGGVEVIRAMPVFNKKFLNGDEEKGLTAGEDFIKTEVAKYGNKGSVIDLDSASYGFEPFVAIRTLVDGDEEYNEYIDDILGELGLPPVKRSPILNPPILGQAITDKRLLALAANIEEDCVGMSDEDMESVRLAAARMRQLDSKIELIHAEYKANNNTLTITRAAWLQWITDNVIADKYKNSWTAAENLEMKSVTKLFGLSDAAAAKHAAIEEGRPKKWKPDMWAAKILALLIDIPSYALDAVALSLALNIKVVKASGVFNGRDKLKENQVSASILLGLTTEIKKILTGQGGKLPSYLWIPHLHVVDMEIDDGFSIILHSALLRAKAREPNINPRPSLMIQIPEKTMSPLTEIVQFWEEREFAGVTVFRDKDSDNTKKILSYYDSYDPTAVVDKRSNTQKLLDNYYEMMGDFEEEMEQKEQA